MDSWSESVTIIFSNARSSSVRFLIFFSRTFLTCFCTIALISCSGELFYFLRMFVLLLFCLPDQCLERSVFIHSMSAHAMVLAKLFVFSHQRLSLLNCYRSQVSFSCNLFPFSCFLGEYLGDRLL